MGSSVLSLPVTRWQIRMMKKMLLAVVSLLLLMSLSGCNTFRGFGEDVQHLGGAISRSAG